MQTPLDVGRAFAQALDEDRFDDVARLLHEACVYAAPSGQCVGAAAIIASYRGASQGAREKIDGLIFRSEVELAGDSRVRVLFTDELRVGSEHHSYRCEQHLEIVEGRVVRIEHAEIPGERERLRTFLERRGVEL